MTLSELAAFLQGQSFEKVVVRTRQYYRESGRGGTTHYGNPTITEHHTFYDVATEVQMVACHPNALNGDGTPGFVWVSFNNPAPTGCYPHNPHPPALRSVV